MKKAGEIKREISAYMNTEMKLALEVDHMGTLLPKLIKKNFDVEVFTGQKRVVVEVGNEVLKLVYSPDGLDDNINDLLTSAALKQLAEGGSKSKIDEDDLELFALSEPYDKDPYIIVAPKLTRITESSEFNEWYKENKRQDDYKGMTKNSMVGYFIMTNKKHNRNQNRIIEIVSRYMVGSDIYAYKVPENYGLNDNGDLALLDLGSILPKYKDVDVDCSICGRGKKLLVPTAKYNNMDDIDSLMLMKTGIYCCSGENCSDYVKNIHITERSNNLTDAVVFADYQEACADSETYIEECARIAHVFVPQVDVEDIAEFRTELIQDSGHKFNMEDIKVIYRNSLSYLLSPIHSDNEDEIEEVMSDFEEDDTFDDFKDDIYDAIKEDECDLFDLYAALLYVKAHIAKDETSTVNLFSVLNVTNKSNFVSFLEEIDTIDSDEYSDLWEVIKTLAKKNGRKDDDDDDED